MCIMLQCICSAVFFMSFLNVVIFVCIFCCLFGFRYQCCCWLQKAHFPKWHWCVKWDIKFCSVPIRYWVTNLITNYWSYLLEVLLWFEPVMISQRSSSITSRVPVSWSCEMAWHVRRWSSSYTGEMWCVSSVITFHFVCLCTLCLKKTTLMLHTIDSKTHINRFQ